MKNSYTTKTVKRKPKKFIPSARKFKFGIDANTSPEDMDREMLRDVRRQHLAFKFNSAQIAMLSNAQSGHPYRSREWTRRS